MRVSRTSALRASRLLVPILLAAACGPPSGDGAAETEVALAPTAAFGREVPAAERNIEVRDGYEALGLLLAGNERFVRGTPHHDHESRMRRALLERGQDPFGIVLGCADSRVPPELIFDVGFGDTFVIRVAGNIVDENEAGSIEYALAHLGTPLVVVLGHEGCGAITAALDTREHKEPEELEHLLHDLLPGLAEIDPELKKRDRIHLGVEANVRYQVAQLARIAEGIEGLNPGTLIVGAVYELDSGRVRVLEGAQAGPLLAVLRAH